MKNHAEERNPHVKKHRHAVRSQRKILCQRVWDAAHQEKTVHKIVHRFLFSGK